MNEGNEEGSVPSPARNVDLIDVEWSLLEQKLVWIQRKTIEYESNALFFSFYINDDQSEWRSRKWRP